MSAGAVLMSLIGSLVVWTGCRCCCRYCMKPATLSPQQLYHMPPLLVGKRYAARMAVARALDRRKCARKSVARSREIEMRRSIGISVCVVMRESKLRRGM
jgi:hypothetical protein